MTTEEAQTLLDYSETEGLSYAAKEGYFDSIADAEFMRVLQAYNAAYVSLEEQLSKAEELVYNVDNDELFQADEPDPEPDWDAPRYLPNGMLRGQR